MKQLTEFDHETALVKDPESPGSFTIDLSEKWSSLVGIHGGMLSALAVRAAQDLAPGRSVRTSSTSFLRVATVGPARLWARELRSGRTVSTIEVNLEQQGRLVTVTRLTLMIDRPGIVWSTPIVDDLAPIQSCVPIVPPGKVVHFERAEGLLDPTSLPFTEGERARVRGYVRPLECRPVDAVWLAMAVDWFPPPAFVRVAPPTGGVSIDLTTHFHRPSAPPGDWLVGRFEITDSAGALALEHGTITDRSGVLLAESFHTRLTATD